MILPIDRRINSRVPWITYSLIAINSWALFWVILVARSAEQLMDIYMTYGFVPGDVRPHAVFTHMFMHGGGIHLVGNMVFLGFFGLNVERRLGPLPFLVIYLVSGLTSLGLFLGMSPAGNTPLVGASGAISGVTGMYLALYRTRFVTVFSVAGPFKTRAAVFVLFWAGVEIFNAVISGEEVMVAHWAHVGGFVGGFAAVSLLIRGGFKGYPEDPDAGPKNLSASFTQLRYIPTSAEPLSTFSLLARHEEPPPPETKSFLSMDTSPHHVASGLSLQEAEDLNSRLENHSYPCRIFPDKSLVQLPILELAGTITINGHIGWQSEAGYPVARDPDFVYFMEAGRVADTIVLDLFLTSPWTNVRTSGKICSRPLEEIAGDLRKRLPEVHLGPGFIALSEGQLDRIPEFAGQPELDRHHLWFLQGKTLK